MSLNSFDIPAILSRHSIVVFEVKNMDGAFRIFNPYQSGPNRLYSLHIFSVPHFRYSIFISFVCLRCIIHSKKKEIIWTHQLDGDFHVTLALFPFLFASTAQHNAVYMQKSLEGHVCVSWWIVTMWVFTFTYLFLQLLNIFACIITMVLKMSYYTFLLVCNCR